MIQYYYKIISVFCLIAAFLVHKLFIKHFSLLNSCDLESHPFIYGKQLCNSFYNEEVLVENDILSNIIYIFGSKLILKGTLNKEPVVLKKLGTYKELKALDLTAQQYFDTSNIANLNTPDIKVILLNSIYTPVSGNLIAKLHYCPQLEDIDYFLNTTVNQNFHSDVLFYLNIWAILKVNPEPLILQILTPPAWPVPKYYGSCGRIAVFEDCGKTLINYYNSPWAIRANISHQLLSAALKLTFAHPDLAFYLTDISADNIAINNKGIAKFIDLENVIVLNKKANLNDKNWNITHRSEDFYCEDCFSFSPKDVCAHRISDHNVYAVCKEILSDSSLLPRGFLHSPPRRSLFSAQQYAAFVNECVNPTNFNVDGRFKAARQLSDFLVKSIQYDNSIHGRR